MRTNGLRQFLKRARWVFLSMLCIPTLTCFSQTGSNADLLHLAHFAETSPKIAHPGEIVDWQRDVTIAEAWRKPDYHKAYWVRLDSASIPRDGLVSVYGQSSVTAYAVSARDTVVMELGFSRPLYRLPLQGASDIIPVSKFPQRTSALFLKIIPFTQQPYPVTITQLSIAQYEKGKLETHTRRLGYHIFLGAGTLSLLFLAAFAFFQFSQNRKKAYLFYGLYMVCMALYFGRVLEYHFGVPVFWGFFYDGYGLAEIIALMLSYVMYMQFTQHFLGIDQRHPGLRMIVRIWTGLCLIMTVTGLLLSITHTTSPVFLHVYTWVRFLMPVIVVLFLWRIARAHLAFSRYVLLGSGFLLLGGLMALSVTFILREMPFRLLQEPFFYMLSGVLLESFAFALGLGKQARQTELDKIATQEQLIVQLQKESQLEREIRESQVQTLRAQMNPHFIFNALNSIQHFILTNDKETAVKYLTRVSQLIRRILQNSTAPSITIDEEVQTLQAYVEIEQLRFHPPFTFTCTVEEELDTGFQRIPHLMIQPFIENAILHGLVHKKEPGGTLTLDIRSRDEQSIEVVVTDNGIGRAEAARIAAQNPRKHRSISTASIESRIRLMLPEETQPVVIEDLKDAAGSVCGTRVRLIVPLI